MIDLTYKELKQKSISYKPADLIAELGFAETLKVARLMLVNEDWDESLQSYATNLLEAVKNKYPEQWNSSWRYDAFLGYAYDIVLKYDERYAAYKRAFDKIYPQPPELLVAMAGCCWAPGKPPISEEQAIKTTPYIEAIELLRGLYKSVGNVKEQIKWENV